MAKATLVGADGMETDIPPPITISAENMGDDTDAPAVENEAPRKRGRPKGSGTKTTGEKPSKSKARKSDDIEALARQIMGIHQIAAMASGFPEMAISDVEAAMLAKGIDAVSQEYGLSLDGKTGAALQLFAAAAMVYGPRAVVIKRRIANQKQAEAPYDVPAN